MPPQQPTIGRIVHYHFDFNDRLTTRPAIVVSVFGDTGVNLANLRVFFDGTNDGFLPGDSDWRTSVPQLAEGADPKPGTWSWPPRG